MENVRDDRVLPGTDAGGTGVAATKICAGGCGTEITVATDSEVAGEGIRNTSGKSYDGTSVAYGTYFGGFG